MSVVHNVIVLLITLSGLLLRENVSANVLLHGKPPRLMMSHNVSMLVIAKSTGGVKEARMELVSVNALKDGNLMRDVPELKSALLSALVILSTISGILQSMTVSVNVNLDG